jgi:glutathione S-transferase
MSSPYVLHGAPRSRSTRIAWALEELGVDWTWKPMSFQAGDHRAPEFLALNPGGKVPVLVHGDVVLTESAAITRYLAARHPDAGLLPREGTAEAAKVDQWLFFVTTELEQALWTKAKHTFALPEKIRVPAVRATADAELARAAEVADSMFGAGPYATGTAFTIADILFAHTCFWARAAGLWDALSPRLKDYAKTQLKRPAYQRAVQRESNA